MKRKTVPVFIPHLGCPQQCVFCDQHSITDARAPAPEAVAQEIADKLQSIDRGHTEVTLAFFGGSFTAIPRAQMLAYLEAAQPFGFDRIRISTRPDAIDTDVLEILHRYGVTDVELGIQSTDDTVLRLCRRGHTAAQSATACRLIRQHGFVLGGQMMIGLPGATAGTEQQTARDLCAFGAQEARIYPLCVFDRTPLAKEVRRGAFVPLTTEQAIGRSADVLEILSEKNVRLLRIGLCETEVLSEKIIAGSYHPAFGELVLGEVFYRKLLALLSPMEALSGKRPCIAIPRGCLSRAVGHHKRNRDRLCRLFALRGLHFLESDALQGTECVLRSDDLTDKEVPTCDCNP